ncbi:uncharacterized protein PHACADRAFT_169454 [Phanerochaete carnosa HHB-10118-sp]|uniref:Uncharacterized protein n=1 Tax=Phanerochaete carnosa (strain HHB-10118-sp) TaxID=650164 RepID=K5WIP7_PHACS|nr:uncharacterized protein PHACADRAFT_169454 [Phanerochaete carnosa HHB-10118-sp]EKM58984.1 hypothetical protein PHACADRAFT_169454 [Phanerochaete carnosa HHB-10118-sp]
MSLQPVSAGVLQDVVALQGNEIIRLKAALADARQRISTLREEIAGLKGNQSVPSVDSKAGSKPPSYNDITLCPVDDGGLNAAALKHFKNILKSLGTPKPSRCVFNARSATVRWEDGRFEVFSIIKPESRLLKKGGWSDVHNSKLRGRLEVLGELSGNCYYLGRYQATHNEAVAPNEYPTLPKPMQDAILRWSCSKTHRSSVQLMLTKGELPLRRFFLRRESFDQVLYERLLGTAPSPALALAERSAEHGASDGEEGSDDD